MKTRLLKKLRKKASERYIIEKVYSMYRIYDKELYYVCETENDFDSIISDYNRLVRKEMRNLIFKYSKTHGKKTKINYYPW